MVFYRKGQAYMIRILNGVYTDMDAPFQGRNNEWTTQMQLSATEDPVTGLLFTATRFRRLI